MEAAVRCRVQCWAEFGDLHCGTILHTETEEVLLHTEPTHLITYNSQEKRIQFILQYESPVSSLALSDDKSHVYVLCQNNDLYCTSLSLHSSSHSQKRDDCTTSIISRDSVVIEDGQVESFILVEGTLITVSLQDSFWSFNLYEVPNGSTGGTVYRKHAGFQVPAVAATITRNTINAKINSAPVLACIHPSKDSVPKENAYRCHSHLEPLLFRLLFGVDASLVHSPVVFCGFPDGRLFFFPMLLPTMGGQKPKIRMLYSLEQPVKFIGTSVIGEQGPRCLVVLGQMGRILLIMANPASSEGKPADCNFIEQTLQGPVVCANVDGDHLYYSTSKNLLAVPLSKSILSSSSSSSSLTAAEAEKVSTKSERPALLSQSAICLGVCQVIALAEPSILPTGCVQLLALSQSGRLLQVTIPQEKDKESVSKLTSSQAGQTVKDLLAGIGNVWERTSALKHQLQLKNNVLKRLNQVINICNLLSAYQGKEQVASNCKPPIHCHGVAKWSNLLQQDTLVLCYRLENLSACALDQGWTLCIEVQSSLTAEGSSRTYSFALTKLDFGQKMEVSLPLGSGDVGLPFKVHFYLVYSLQSLLCLEEPRHLSDTDIQLSQLLKNTGCISLTLNSLTLDWLDCLRIGEPASHGQISKQNTAWEATCLFLNSRQIHTEWQQPLLKSGPHVVTIRVSSELLKTGLGLDCNVAALCISVLKWLLSGTSETDGEKTVESPVVCAYGPDGQPVRLLTKEVILNDVSSEGPLSVVEVQVESSSVAAVCGLHHAVLRRLQALLKDAAVKCSSPAQLKGQHLCEAVRHVKSVYKELQDSRASSAFGGLMKEKTSESLFQLYLKLRENPLIIL